MSTSYFTGSLLVAEYNEPVDTSSSEGNFLGVDGDTIRVAKNRVISSSSATGYKGELCVGYDEGASTWYLYYCKEDNTWIRMAFSSGTWS